MSPKINRIAHNSLLVALHDTSAAAGATRRRKPVTRKKVLSGAIISDRLWREDVQSLKIVGSGNEVEIRNQGRFKAPTLV